MDADGVNDFWAVEVSKPTQIAKALSTATNNAMITMTPIKLPCRQPKVCRPSIGCFFVLNHIRCRLGFACGLRLISGFRIVYRKAVAGLGKCRISHHLPERRRENFRRQFQSSALNRQEPREHRQEPQNHPIQQEASQRNFPRRNRHKSVVRCVPRTDFAGRRGNPDLLLRVLDGILALVEQLRTLVLC